MTMASECPVSVECDVVDGGVRRVRRREWRGSARETQTPSPIHRLPGQQERGRVRDRRRAVGSFAAAKRAQSSGRSASAADVCTRSVSIALQTEGRETLALNAISAASYVEIGIGVDVGVAVASQRRQNRDGRMGHDALLEALTAARISRSTRPSAFMSATAASRSVVSINCRACSGSPARSPAIANSRARRCSTGSPRIRHAE